MPWKGEKDPYRIWLSEVILQQTRVEQGLGYYKRFIRQYPTIRKLASAPDGEVFKLWEGLGYYNRCRNLLATARYLAGEKNGKFPGTYEGLLELKGVGPYIAAAMASFAWDLPHAVLDGNVFRVLARVYGIDTPVDTTAGKKLFSRLADENLDRDQPGKYNQAIMDFGATVCKPMVPACSHCPVKKHCKAFENGIVNQLPVKEKLRQKKTRWFYYFLFRVEGKVLVHQRNLKDIWQQLYEFYLFEAGEQIYWDENKLSAWLDEQLGVKNYRLLHASPPQQQQLTHQEIRGQFFSIELKKVPTSLENYRWAGSAELKTLAFPRFINSYLESANAMAAQQPSGGKRKPA